MQISSTNVNSKEKNINHKSSFYANMSEEAQPSSESQNNAAERTAPSSQGSNPQGSQGRRPGRRGARQPIKKFKGKIENVFTLAAKNERTGYGFSTFTKSLYEYCLTSMKSPQDIAPVILERKDPFVVMANHLPTVKTVAQSIGTPLEDIDEDDSADEAKKKKQRNRAIEDSVSALVNTELTEFAKRRTQLRSNMAQLWGIIIGQCTPALQEHLKAHSEYNDSHNDYNCVWLLGTLQLLSTGAHETSNPIVASANALRQLYRIKQGPEETLEDYLARFEEYQDQVRLSKVQLVSFEEVPKGYNAEELDENFLAILFLQGADHIRYGSLWTTLANDLSMGLDKYPTSVSKAMHMLTTWKDPTKKTNITSSSNQRSSATSERRDGLTFAQVVSEAIPGTDGSFFENVKCYNCNVMGHYAKSCPERESAIQGAHISCAHSHLLSKEDILLDNQSTVSIVNDLRLVKDLVKDPRGVRVFTNGGYIDADWKGVSTLLPKLRNVWFNQESVANIFSLAEVKKHYRVTMDSATSDTFKVYHGDKDIYEFEERNGLYVFKHNISNKVEEEVRQYSFAQSRDNYSDNGTQEDATNDKNDEIYQPQIYTQRQIKDADRAIELIRNMGYYINPDRLIFMLNHGMIRNCPVEPADVRRAIKLYGPLTALIQGKSTRRTASRIKQPELTPVPRRIYEEHQYVTLCMDHFFVQGLSFFHTISKDIKFRTIEHVDDLTRQTTLQCLISVARVYQINKFKLRQINGDMAYESLRDDLLPVQLVTAPAGEKVPEVERSIRTIKERVRCIVASLPYRKVTKAMLKSFVYEAGRHLNDSPPKDGVSRVHPPARIVANRPAVDYSKLKVRTGQYCMVINTHNNWNSLAPRKIGAIALRPKEDGNGWYLLSLDTWRVVSCGLRNITVMDFTQDVVRAVEERADEEGMTEFRNGDILVQWRDHANVESLTQQEVDDEEGEAYEQVVQVPIMIDEPDHYEVEPNVTTIELEDSNEESNEIEEADHPAEQIQPETHVEASNQSTSSSSQETDNTQEVRSGTQERESNTTEVTSEKGEEELLSNTNAVEGNDTEQVGEPDVQTNCDGLIDDEEDAAADENREEDIQEKVKYNLRPRRSRDYNYLNFAEPHRGPNQSFRRGALSLFMRSAMKQEQDAYLSLQDMYRKIVDIIMRDKDLRKEHRCFTQMSAKRGIAVFGEKAIVAIFKEFKQLHDKGVFKPIHHNELTAAQKRKALREITKIKEKRCGKIKGRTCADGRPQRGYISKDESSSPTISNDAFLMSLIIDALEERDVATADVEGAYLNADMEDFTIMKVTSPDHIRILCEVDETYKEYVGVDESGNEVLYLQLVKALYGCIKSALLWYRLFSETLVDMGFQLNPVDKCVANKMVNGEQCTVAWYIDDNKISHKDPKVVSEVIENIEKRFGKMTVTRGKVHTFLGMNITFKNKQVEIDMKSYCEEAIDGYHRKVYGKAATPARRDIFEVSEDSPLLSEELRENFHSTAALLLYVSLRGRPDILLPVSFLCTRVGKATEEDDEKLLRVLKYLNGTLGMTYKLGAKNLKELKIWVDAAFAVHVDMKGHTGGLVSMGTGAFMCKSSKQKLNVLSSTECELVGAASYIVNAIWLDQFLKYQGYPLEEKMFFQDNESAIRFARNGSASARKNSKHIDVRYFFLKDRLENGGYIVEHCRTTRMLADFFTKPLQGSLFRAMRDVIMGQKSVESLEMQNDNTETDSEGNDTTSDESSTLTKLPLNEERVGKGFSQESFTDNFTDTVAVEEDRTDVVNVSSTGGENEKEIPRVHSFELTQSVV